jgi:hypothetical protein
MRNAALLAAVLTAVVFAGCRQRDTLNVVPDRGGAAMVIGSPSYGGANVMVPGPNEGFYTIKTGERLYQVAKAHNTTLDWLIERNNLTRNRADKLAAGTNIIVPKK